MAPISSLQDRKSLVCFHGSPGSPEDFAELGARMPDVQTVCLVRMGQGNRAACDVLESLRNGAVLLGYSWGSVPCLREAVRSLKHVRGVILVAPFLQPAEPLGGFRKMLLSLPILGDAMLRRVGPGMVEKLLGTTSDPLPVPDRYRAMKSRLADPGALRMAALEKSEPGLTAAEAARLLADAGVPVAVFWGEADKTSPRALHVDPLLASAPNAVQRIFPNAGHALPWTHPTELADAVQEFLRTLPPWESL